MNNNDNHVSQLKQACIKFFYYWWNEPGNNTEQGFDKWIQTEEGKQVASQFKSQSEAVGDPYNELRWPAIASERALREANEKHKPTITDGNKSEFHLAWRLCLEWVQKYYYLSAKVSVGEEKKD